MNYIKSSVLFCIVFSIIMTATVDSVSWCSEVDESLHKLSVSEERFAYGIVPIFPNPNHYQNILRKRKATFDSERFKAITDNPSLFQMWLVRGAAIFLMQEEQVLNQLLQMNKNTQAEMVALAVAYDLDYEERLEKEQEEVRKAAKKRRDAQSNDALSKSPYSNAMLYMMSNAVIFLSQAEVDRYVKQWTAPGAIDDFISSMCTTLVREVWGPENRAAGIQAKPFIITSVTGQLVEQIDALRKGASDQEDRGRLKKAADKLSRMFISTDTFCIEAMKVERQKRAEEIDTAYRVLCPCADPDTGTQRLVLPRDIQSQEQIKQAQQVLWWIMVDYALNNQSSKQPLAKT